jgi:hypothetical protein
MSAAPKAFDLLYDNLSDHMRMQAAEIIKGPGTGERVGKRVVSIERLGSETLVLVDNSVRDVVVIDPFYRHSRCNRQLGGGEGKVVTTFSSCAATAPNASRAPTAGPKSIATTTARPGMRRAAARRRLLMNICM